MLTSSHNYSVLGFYGNRVHVSFQNKKKLNIFLEAILEDIYKHFLII